MAPKTPYFDPWMNQRQQAMKLRADIVETQLDENASRARDIQAAKDAEKSKKRPFFKRLFGKKFRN